MSLKGACTFRSERVSMDEGFVEVLRRVEEAALSYCEVGMEFSVPPLPLVLLIYCQKATWGLTRTGSLHRGEPPKTGPPRLVQSWFCHWAKVAQLRRFSRLARHRWTCSQVFQSPGKTTQVDYAPHPGHSLKISVVENLWEA